MKLHFAAALACTTVLCGTAIAPAFAQEGEVTIYSYRTEDLLGPLVERFEQETGITANVLYASDGLIERAQSEGENSPADVIITVDVGNLALAEQLGVSQPISDSVLERVPEGFRDDDNNWTALSLRARVIYASVDRVEDETLSYDDLADPKWKGRVCTRPGQHVYNIGLIANRIAHYGEEDTREWLEGWRDNLVGAPTGNDRGQVGMIFSGECDLAVVNTYYMGVMATNEEEPIQQEWARSARIVYPSDETGVMVNVSGAILAANAPNKDNGERLIEFLLSDEAQTLYATGNYEYPVIPGVPSSEVVESWGEWTPDTTPLSEIAELRERASQLVDETRFEEGPQN